VPDVEAALAEAGNLGGSRLFGPDKVMEGSNSGSSSTPRDT
jgi:hypothetical protein